MGKKSYNLGKIQHASTTLGLNPHEHRDARTSDKHKRNRREELEEELLKEEGEVEGAAT